jgi:hypothetical protein
MKIRFIYCFIFCFSFIFEIKAQVNKLKNSQLPEVFYKRLVGTMGKDEPIEMNLSKIGTTLKGNYYHKLSGQVRALEGEITEEGTISLQEIDNPKNRLSEPQTFDASLNIYFTSAQDLQGSWEQVDSLADVPFYASETYPVGSVEMNMMRRVEKYGQCGYSPCAEFLLIYPILQNDVYQSKINKKISSVLINQYTIEEKRSFKDFEQVKADFFAKYKIAESKAKPNEKPMWGSHHEVEIVCNAFYILTLEVFSTTYEGGTQPSNVITYLSFDLQTGNLLTLKDILVNNYEKELTQIAEQIFKANYGFSDIEDLRKEGFTFKEGRFALNTNFGFTKQGILFQYNLLEIGANAIGAPQLLIPYSQIKHLIKKESLVLPLIKGD